MKRWEKNIQLLVRKRVPAREIVGRRLPIFGLCMALIVSPLALAISGFTATVGKIDGSGIAVRGVSASLDAPFDRSDATLTIGSLQLSGMPEFRDISLRCAKLQLNNQLVFCGNASGKFSLPDGKPFLIRGKFDLDFITGAALIDIGSFEQMGSGKGAVTFQYRDQSWSLIAKATEFNAAAVAPLIEQFSDADISQVNIAKGEFWLDVNAKGDSAGPEGGMIKLRWQGLAGSNADSTIAAEALAGDLDASARRQAGKLAVKGTLILSNGYAGVDPVYADFAAQPLSLVVEAEGENQRWHVNQLLLWQGTAEKTLLAADGNLQLDLGQEKPLQLAELNWRSDSLKALFPVYAQPLLLGTSFADATLKGGVAGVLEVRSGRLSRADMRFEDVSLNNGNDLYALNGLSGELRWSANSSAPQQSIFGWDSGSLYKLPVGAAQFNIMNENGGFRLLEPMRIPLVDGALKINQLSILPGDASELILDAVIEPISLEPLTKRFGWPAFGGTVAGRIPDIEYRRGELTVGGVLEANLFDGSLQAEGLRIDDLFGRLPKFQASLKMRDLNLEKVTEAFDVGRITGGLDADINELLLIGWRPAAFKARLYSSPKKKLSRKLSQRALDNIADVGGAGAALSTPLIKIFDEFRYDRIEWRCRLIGDVCNMGGIPTSNGYYLIKGSGLPRVDVIGHTKRVDWPLLVKQIKEAISRGEVKTGDSKTSASKN